MSIGDLANDLARILYEQRVLVALVSGPALVGGIVIARQLGWFGAARRHPRRTVGLGILLLGLTLPIGWYLASPIFVRTSLVEAFPGPPPPSPVSVAAVGTASPAASPEGSVTPATFPEGSASPAPTPTREPTPVAPVIVAAGTWEGTDDFHFARGTASIIEIAPGRHQLRLEDFSIRNGPDLYVYLSPAADGWSEEALELGVLKATDGAFGYDIPRGVDPALYRSAVVWCKAFSHLFATARFER